MYNSGLSKCPITDKICVSPGTIQLAQNSLNKSAVLLACCLEYFKS